MRRADRLMQLVQILRDGSLHRAQDLAAAVGVSLRSIYRDMETLAASGVPISGERGVGYHVTAAITLPPLNLTLTEVEALHPGREVRAGIIAVTGSAPHEVAVLHLDSAMLGAGEAKRRPLLNRYAECVRADHWPARYPRPVYLDVPDWAYPDLSADEGAFDGDDHE